MRRNFSFPGVLYCLTAPTTEVSAIEQAKAMIAGGATIIQYRDKNASPAEISATVAELKKLPNILLVINDHVEIAHKHNVHAVHLGQEDILKYGSTMKDAIQNLRDTYDMHIVGISTHSVEQAQEAEAAGANYIGIGPLNATPTKPTAVPLSAEEAQKMAKVTNIPSVCIGGINRANLEDAKKVGSNAIAMVRAITEGNISHNVTTFLTLLSQ